MSQTAHAAPDQGRRLLTHVASIPVQGLGSDDWFQVSREYRPGPVFRAVGEDFHEVVSPAERGLDAGIVEIWRLDEAVSSTQLQRELATFDQPLMATYLHQALSALRGRQYPEVTGRLTARLRTTYVEAELDRDHGHVIDTREPLDVWPPEKLFAVFVGRV